MSVPNMKFLCLTLCQGEVCIDDANTNTNDNGQFMIVSGTLVNKPNEPKKMQIRPMFSREFYLYTKAISNYIFVTLINRYYTNTN